MMKCHPLWPTYIGEKGKTLGKTYGIKSRCYWESHWGIHWEPDGNPLGTLKGTCWEQREKKKKILLPPNLKFKRKIKIKAL
jgi:hypothetical protein